MTQRIGAWLVTAPVWEAGVRLHTDQTFPTPGCAGLFPLGIQETGRSEDVVGNVAVDYTARFRLVRVGSGTPDADAAWLLRLQQWLGLQSELGLCPELGDDPNRVRITAEQGSLKDTGPGGMRTHTVTILARYRLCSCRPA